MLSSLALSMLILLAQPADSVSADDRSGPSRHVKCQLDNGPAQPCRFTPLFGDGSFNIELEKGRELRIVVDGERGWLFVPVSPEQRIRILNGYHRDEVDRACWVADGVRDEALAGPPNRICVYN
jgi:hypothetical protein